ncbi:MAG: calcium-binding protein [Arthrospira sp. SH-MAG29]|nr:calcium-binding protein [Arthrospira sp. SH-MAG29]MBS0017216.1 calcium-binding protein [Arthrospira sp. SH-MAG29]
MSSAGVVIDPEILEQLFSVDTLPADLIIPPEGSVNGGTNNSGDNLGNGTPDFGETLSSNGSVNEITVTDSAGETVRGTGATDRILGGDGPDSLLGGSNNDTIYGGPGSDTLLGEAGNDLLFGNQGRDLLYGGNGNDTLYGGKEVDTLYGEAGDDLLFGNLANDWLYGGDGNDTLFGGKNDDILYGGDGNDLLSGDTGADTLIGGEGRDSFVVSSLSGGVNIPEADVIMDYTPSDDDILLSGGLRSTNLEFVSGTSVGLEGELENSTVIRLRQSFDPNRAFVAIVVDVDNLTSGDFTAIDQITI